MWEEEDKAKAPDAERRGVKRLRDEKDEHGRAYHEFREEAYNSRSKSPPPPEEEPPEGEEDETLVILDTYTSDLQFRASRDRYGGQPLFSERFPGLWAGARSTHGVTRGRVCFQAKVSQNLPGKEGSSEVPLLRVGWSVDFSHSQLGEDEFSYGFDGRGLKVENGKFEEFGESFGENDVIGCFATRGPEPEELDAKSRELLTQQAAQCLSKLVQIAPRARRNFILDQCNVYNSGQRRKLSAFKGFSRKVVVIVPTEPDWEQRLEQRRQAEGDDVPESVMLEMKANYSIPEKNEYVDEVVFGELGRDEAAPLVLRWKEEARKQLPPSEKRGNRRNNRNKRNRQNRNRGQGYGQGEKRDGKMGKTGVKRGIKTGENGIAGVGSVPDFGPVPNSGSDPAHSRSTVGGQRRGYDSRVYGGQQQPQYWGQPGNRGGYRNFYERYRGYDDRFYGRDYDYNRYRDYYRQYNREWQNYYQDRDRYYRNYYGYQGYR
ncbi:hypothetical protein IHE44_0010903 [Lamprotornis superbus]|uniref:SPRY domain-containing protein n=1 Tax=Lamprotornis superbus TaxID=245042 RepID=A0A835NEH6_9PASS|nr:hypothetical protein IHE44_0010903 [Lamprotornis superbus]